MHTNKKLIAALAAAALMTACGGGGSDSANQPGQPLPAPAPAPVPAPGVPTGVPVMLPAGSPAADLLNTINAQITRCGYAPMQPVQDLQRAAQAHADYSRSNGYEIGHTELPSRPGFTGADHRDRIRAAGGTQERAFASSEGVGGYGGRDVLSSGLLSAPYHLADLLSGWTEIGVGTAADPQTGLLLPGMRQGVAVLVYGGPQRDGLREGEVRNFPCDGTTHVGGQGGPETPDPAPDLGDRFGNSLIFDTAKTGAIDVRTIELRDVSSGQVVPLRRLANNNVDPAQVPWRAVYFPAEILPDGKRFVVTATGTTWDNASRSGQGSSWSRSYTFTTFQTY